jgi:hypothetical protein
VSPALTASKSLRRPLAKARISLIGPATAWAIQSSSCAPTRWRIRRVKPHASSLMVAMSGQRVQASLSAAVSSFAEAIGGAHDPAGDGAGGGRRRWCGRFLVVLTCVDQPAA